MSNLRVNSYRVSGFVRQGDGCVVTSTPAFMLGLFILRKCCNMANKLLGQVYKSIKFIVNLYELFVNIHRVPWWN